MTDHNSSRLTLAIPDPQVILGSHTISCADSLVTVSERFEIEPEIFAKAKSFGPILKELPVGFRKRL